MSVCLTACVSKNNHMFKLHEIFDTCYLWPWLGLHLTAVQYVMYFRFYDVMFPHNANVYAKLLQPQRPRRRSLTASSEQACYLVNSTKMDYAPGAKCDISQCLVDIDNNQHAYRSSEYNTYNILLLFWCYIERLTVNIYCDVTDNRMQSREGTIDQDVCDEDSVRRRPEVSQNVHEVHSRSFSPVTKSSNLDAIPMMNGSTTPNSVSPANHANCNTTDVKSPYKVDSLRFAELDNEVNDHPASLRHVDGCGSTLDTRWKRSSCGDDVENASSMDQRRKNRLHNLERGGDTPASCSTPGLKPRGVNFYENDQTSVKLKSLSVLSTSDDDRPTSETTNSSSTPSEDADSRTPRTSDCSSNSYSTQKPAVDCDRVTVNGSNSPAPIIDGISIDISMDDDGVVFDTSDVEVVFAVKPENEPSTGLVEFGEPISDKDSLDWDVRNLDLPQKTRIIHDLCGDPDTENSALLDYMEYGDESHRIPVEPGNGVMFSSESSKTCDAVNERSSLSHRPSSNIPAQIFSDISDDEDVADAENNRLLPRRNEIRLNQRYSPTAQPAAVDYEAKNIRNNGSTATQSKNDTQYDHGEGNVPQKTAILNLAATCRNNDERSDLVAASDEVCRNPAVLNSCPDWKLQNDSRPQSNDETDLQADDCTVMHPLTELNVCSSAWSRPARDFGRMRRRRRNTLGGRTVGDVVMLLKTRGASEYSAQQTELSVDVSPTLENPHQDLFIAAASPDRGAMRGDEAGSPMDEAPPLLAITDLLEDGTNDGELTAPGRRTSTASAGYDSDDAEAAMPVIEDMRSLLPTENEGGEMNDEGAISSRKAPRKISKPLKTAMTAAAKDVLEIERTRSLYLVCDRCSFTCGSEQVLNRHIKVCHRSSARSKEQARHFCVECSTSFDDRESFLEHLAHHPGQHLVRYYVCSHCGTDAVDMETMEQHVSSSHAGAVVRFEVVQQRVTYLDNLLDCPLCGAAFRWKDNFVGHVKEYHQMEQVAAYLEHGYQNESCPEKLTIHREDVVGHSSRNNFHISPSNSGSSRYRDLRDASSSFSSPQSVIVHICCRCTFSTDDIGSYLEHYKGHFSKSRPTGAAVIAKRVEPEPQNNQTTLEQRGVKIGGSYACHLCPFKTPKRMFYHRHMAIHERNSGMTDGYRCGYCQFAHPRVQCMKFHLGRYHANRPTKLIRISGGTESEVFDDGNEDIDEEAYPSSSVQPSIRTGNASLQVSGYPPLPSSSFFSTATASKGAVSINQKSKSFPSDRIKRLNEFERRLPPSMVYPEPLKCPLCSFANQVRIVLIRHLRTHKNDDDDEEMESSKEDDVSDSVVAESLQSRTREDKRYTQAMAVDIEMRTSDIDTTTTFTSTKPRFTQRSLADCLVIVIFNVFTVH